MTAEKTDPGYRLYGSKLIMHLVSDLAGEGDGVKDAKDIEYIHRMRVASRRLRAALPLFENCFPRKAYIFWENEIKLITKSLGKARDLDVQIAFLREYESKLSKDALSPAVPRFLPTSYQTELYSPVRRPALPPASEKKIKEPVKLSNLQKIKRFFSGTKDEELKEVKEPEVLAPKMDENNSSGERLGVECLIMRLMQERALTQPEVVRAVERFERSKVAQSITKKCMETVVSGKIENLDTKTGYSYLTAYSHIMKALENLFLYEKALFDPERISAHHEMRIAAKKLRYTMEAYKNLYGDELGPSIKMIKELQDYLGEIHDCDVWTETLPAFLLEEEKRCLAYFGNTSFLDAITPGVQALFKNRENERKKLHTDAVSYWEKSSEVFKQLEKNIEKPLHDLRFRTLTIPETTSSIAFLGDIHANLPALLATVSDAKSRGTEMFLCVGDMIGFGPFPKETLLYLSSIGAKGVIGNIEEAILLSGSSNKVPKTLDEKRYASHKRTWKKLTPEQRQELEVMPIELRFSFGGRRIAIMHHPDFPENVCPETLDTELEQLVRETDADVIICAHTHRSFAKDVHGTWVVNTGSVGRSADKDLRASYLLMTKDPFALHHIRIPYDNTSVLAKLKKQKDSKHLTYMFEYGLDFDEAVSAEKTGEVVITQMPDMVTVETAEVCDT